MSLKSSGKPGFVIQEAVFTRVNPESTVGEAGSIPHGGPTDSTDFEWNRTDSESNLNLKQVKKSREHRLYFGPIVGFGFLLS